MNYLLVLQIAPYFPAIFAVNITKYFQPCKPDDACLTDAIEKAIHFLCHEGAQELNLPKLDPIKIPQIVIGTKGNVADLQQKYIDVKLYGFKNATVSDAHLNRKTKSLKFTTYTPQFDQVSDYDIKGRLLIFPIRGKGKAVIAQMNVTVLHEIRFQSETRDSKEYWKVRSYTISTLPQKIVFMLGNLFNGNEVLSQQVHAVVNENWQIVWDEAKPDIDRSYGTVYEDFARRLFHVVPIDEIFLQ